MTLCTKRYESTERVMINVLSQERWAAGFLDKLRFELDLAMIISQGRQG